jgi:hypothetical protein
MEIVGAYACSHTSFFVSRRDAAPQQQVDLVYRAFAQMGDAIRAAKPDAVVIVGTDHGRIYPLTHVPQFAIGVSETAVGLGDGDLPKYQVPIHQGFAQAILGGAIDEGVDLNFSESMTIDHSFVTPLMLAFGEDFVPIVPIVQNCNVPPLPTLQRSYDVGAKIGRAIRRGPPGRVVIVGTGGLSHWVGSPAQQAYMRSPAGTRIARERGPLILDDVGEVNVAFDEAFLATLGRGEAPAFVREWSTERLYDVAGNGAQEIRNWLLVAGAVEDRPATVLAYAGVREWLTGTGLVQFQV